MGTPATAKAPNHFTEDPCYDGGIPFFGENGFRMTGLLNPESSGIRPFYFGMILAVYLGHGNFHPGAGSFFVFLRGSVFWERS